MPHNRLASASRNSSPEDIDHDSESSSSLPRSPSHLVLVQEPDDLPELELWQSDTEDVEAAEGSRRQGETNDIPEIRQGPSYPALGVLRIGALLLAPSLKLGTTQLLNWSLQRHSLPMPIAIAAISLILSAGLNAFAVHIWLMLGQYVRRWTIEGVVGEAFVGFTTGGQRLSRRSSAYSPWKKLVVRTTRGLVVLGSSFLCAAYLRESTDLLVPLVPKSSYTFERVYVAAALGVFVVPFITATSLASKRIMYANYASIALYVIVAVVATVHRFQVGDGDDGSSVGIDRELDGGLVKRIPIRVRLAGGAWEWLDVALFAFTTQFFTFPLFVSYSQSVSAKNARQEQSRRAAAPSSPASPTAPRLKKQKRKTPPTWHFFLIACGTGAISIVLVALPLFLGYRQDAARSPTTPNPSPSPPKGMTSLIQGRILPPYIEASFNALRVLQAAYLVLGIPPLWISTLVPRLHSTTISTRWVNDIKWHWVLFVSLISLASFAPPSLAHFVARTASLSTIGFSFLVPAVIHVVLHTFRRPLAIILPADSPSSEDLLLRRKERSLQRKRWLRRAGWDTGVWVFLAPIGLLSWLWWAGRVVGLW